jgi:hypothetical protein
MSSIPEKVKTPVFAGQGRIEWCKKEVPQPQAGQILLQVRATRRHLDDITAWKNAHPELKPCKHLLCGGKA